MTLLSQQIQGQVWNHCILAAEKWQSRFCSANALFFQFKFCVWNKLFSLKALLMHAALNTQPLHFSALYIFMNIIKLWKFQLHSTKNEQIGKARGKERNSRTDRQKQGKKREISRGHRMYILTRSKTDDVVIVYTRGKRKIDLCSRFIRVQVRSLSFCMENWLLFSWLLYVYNAKELYSVRVHASAYFMQLNSLLTGLFVNRVSVCAICISNVCTCSAKGVKRTIPRKAISNWIVQRFIWCQSSRNFSYDLKKFFFLIFIFIKNVTTKNAPVNVNIFLFRYCSKSDKSSMCGVWIKILKREREREKRGKE